MRAIGGRPLVGTVAAPGDKSISHRALLLGAMAEGETRIVGLLESDDVRRTAAAMRLLGAEVDRHLSDDGPVWTVAGRDWRTPARPLYFGNSGTGARLVLGAAAGRRIAAAFDGDASLRARPMRRVAEPLVAMGAQIDLTDGRLPLRLHESRLRAVEYRLRAASAQVKSAVLLAGLGADGVTRVIEPVPSRDHTERLLPAFGASLSATRRGADRIIDVSPGRLRGTRLTVPGDPSSAAFLAAAAAITPGSAILIRGVLVNPLRTGFFETLKQMGADIEFRNRREASGEAVADLAVSHSPLVGVRVPAARAPAMIDEYPILAVVAACAEGETLMEGVAELRLKESDRIAAIVAGLQANGVPAACGQDWLRVRGGLGAPPGGGCVETRLDHRIAMSFLVLGLAARAPVAVDDGRMIGTSFPGFVDSLRALGAELRDA
jgi:3-phosphoshikimate 1-carboxyvinyltransferase